jgi:predicted pyridoxine 5'-phosphate oxidase superfamily flavin-nucleotide-binding protein
MASVKNDTVFSPAVRAFMDEPQRVARLATVDPEGYPHVVPMWFLRDGDTLLFITDRGDRKVANARAKPHGAAVIGGDMDSDATGYLIRGDLSLQEPDGGRTARLIRHYLEGEEAERAIAQLLSEDQLFVCLAPRSVVRVL